MDGQIRDRLKCPKVLLLPLGLQRVARAVGDKSSKVTYPNNMMPWQEYLGQFANIEPPVWCPSQGAIVKIEPIYVNVGSD